MKPSHFSTPRTESDTTFWMGGDPIERPTRPHTGFWRWVAFSLLALLALTLIAGHA